MGIETIIVILVGVGVILWLIHLSQRISELRVAIEKRTTVLDELHLAALRSNEFAKQLPGKFEQLNDIHSTVSRSEEKLDKPCDLGEVIGTQTQTIVDLIDLLKPVPAGLAEIKAALPQKRNAKGQFEKKKG